MGENERVSEQLPGSETDSETGGGESK